jgi:ADP-heptose:LPS heptosyltransferase
LFFRLCSIKYLLAVKGFYEISHPRSSNGDIIPLPKEADAMLERLKFDGILTPAKDEGSMNLQITADERAKAENWWQQNTARQPLPNSWFAVCVGGKTAAQLWPWERYVEVMRLLVQKNGLFPVVIGGREDREIGAKLLAQCGIGLCAAGELTVRESAALMAGARFYLGNDTGVMHLAAAVGIPCVGVFSARNWPGIWEPYGRGHKVLRFDVPCSGCHLSICNQDLKCLTNISVDQVYQACREIMEAKSGLSGSSKSQV